MIVASRPGDSCCSVCVCSFFGSCLLRRLLLGVLWCTLTMSRDSNNKPATSLPHYMLNETLRDQSTMIPSENQRLHPSTSSSNDAQNARHLAESHHASQAQDSDSHANKVAPDVRPTLSSRLSEKPRDPRDSKGKALTTSTSRPASPYTRNPPIDFDGLSWPSMQLSLA